MAGFFSTASRAWLAAGAAASLLGVVACGTVSTAARPSPAPTVTPTQYDLQLLSDLGQLSFTPYLAPLQIDNYVFNGAGLNYHKTALLLDFGGLPMTEWHAVTFNPSSGSCEPEVSDMTGSFCQQLGTSPKGRAIYGGLAGGLPGGRPDFQHFYTVIGSTGVGLNALVQRIPTLHDVMMVVDSMAAATPAQVVGLNQQARALATSLHDGAARKLDFATYVPDRTIQHYRVDRYWIGNPTDPLHPYLDIHYVRSDPGNNVAVEFWVDEFRDDIPLSSTHCGIENPELTMPQGCTLLFTTPGGVDVYGTYGSTRFDRGSTRITFLLDMRINQLNQDDVAAYVDSFHKVDATTIPAV
jgi:hypothetical protein